MQAQRQSSRSHVTSTLEMRVERKKCSDSIRSPFLLESEGRTALHTVWCLNRPRCKHNNQGTKNHGTRASNGSFLQLGTCRIRRLRAGGITPDYGKISFSVLKRSELPIFLLSAPFQRPRNCSIFKCSRTILDIE